MGFGTELQRPASHAALVRLGDAELRLLECVRKCVSQRVRADRDYAAALTATVATATRMLGTEVGGGSGGVQQEFSTPTFQAWKQIISETSSMASVMRENADSLSTSTLEKLSLLISEKRAAQKHYADERARLDAQFQKLQDAVTRQKSEYEKYLAKVAAEKAKYNMLSKGKGGSKVDDARGKFVKMTSKAHKAHNDYVCALHEASLHQKSYLRKTLPCLLDYHEQVQQTMVEQCKHLLKEFSELTSTNTETFSTCHSNIKKKVTAISPKAEFDDFLNKHKGDPIALLKFDFDSSLLAGYSGNLEANEVALDDLTVDTVTISKAVYMERMGLCQQNLKSKREELQRLESELDNMSGLADDMDITQKAQYSMCKRAVMLLKKEMTELGCLEEKWQILCDLLSTQLQENPLPRPAITFDECSASINGDSSKLETSLEDAGGGISGKLNKVFRKFGNKNAQTPPNKDSLDPIEVNRAVANQPHQSPSNGYQEVDIIVHKPNFDKLTLQPGRAMDEEEWYHGVLPREEVQRLLTTDGDYLVRQSVNKKSGELQYVLSVYWTSGSAGGGGDGGGGAVSHYKHFIIQGGDNQWRFEGDAFPSIQELIIAQHKSGLPVTKKSEAILLRPIMRETWELSNDDVVLGMKIGDGNFGCVYKGKLKDHAAPVAIKTCKETLSDDMKKKFLQEGRILKQYDHKNIVRFIGIAATRQPVMILMEYVSGGALSKFLRKHGSSRSAKQMVKMCLDASAGMAYLEANGCIHRDLAARNCLVGEQDVVKISDFGMSREEEEYTVSGGLKQIPIKWTAPEALHYARYTSACDVWSYGILVWEIFSLGSTPYPGLTNTQARERIDEGYRMPPPDSMSDPMSAIMSACWEAEVEDRPKFEKILTDLEKLHKST